MCPPSWMSVSCWREAQAGLLHLSPTCVAEMLSVEQALLQRQKAGRVATVATPQDRGAALTGLVFL